MGGGPARQHDDRVATTTGPAEAVEARRRALLERLAARERADGVDVGRRSVAEAVGAATLAGRRPPTPVLEGLGAAGVEARRALAEATHERDLAQRLVQHLSARGFERWLLDEAMGAWWREPPRSSGR